MRDLLPHLQLPLTTVLAAPFMFLLFLGIVFWVYKSSRRGLYREAEKLPLD